VTVVSGVTETSKDLAPNGVLRAAINLGNPALAQGTPAAPAGVTVDVARELGARLGVPVDLACFAAARESFEAMARGDADICFLAAEPARAEQVAFTAPYVVIEGVYVVPADSRLATPGDVDRDGVRVGVNEGSAYDLFLSRTLQHASLVRGDDGITLFREQDLRRGPEGQRLHQRRAPALRPGQRPGSSAGALGLSRHESRGRNWTPRLLSDPFGSSQRGTAPRRQSAGHALSWAETRGKRGDPNGKA
jgi:polar amino acid transport system substrate-binding protein